MREPLAPGNIFTITTSKANGANAVNIVGPTTQFVSDPTWSPDGTKILFDGGRFDWGEPWTSMANGVIYAMNADGSNLVSIGDTSKLRSQPVWQPIPVRAPQFTDTGNNVAVQPIDSSTGTAPATITFGSVSQAGATTVTSSSTSPSTPSGFKVGSRRSTMILVARQHTAALSRFASLGPKASLPMKTTWRCSTMRIAHGRM